MQHTFTLLLTLVSSLLCAQIVTTDPAAPTGGRELTIIYDASLGNAGLADCGCDVYIHAGTVTSASSNQNEWRHVPMTWGTADERWKMTPVAGEANQYTFTFSPTLRQFFNVPAAEEILRLGLVFRDANGDRQGKTADNGDIFVEINAEGELGITLTGQPEEDRYALGRILPVTVGATSNATITLTDNGNVLTTVSGTDLNYDLVLTEPGEHLIKAQVTDGNTTVADSFYLTGELMVDLLSPTLAVRTATAGATFEIAATSYIESELVLLNGDATVTTTTDDTLRTSVNLPDTDVTTYTVMAVLNGDTAITTATFVTGAPAVGEAPGNVRPGATRTEDGGIVLLLRAPQKSDVFVVGNFNDWSPVAASRMTRTPNDTSFWLKIPADALPEGDLLYQYAIDGDGRFADPYSTLVLDPDDDPFIGEETFADVPEYPSGRAQGMVSWLRLAAPAFTWSADGYQRPDPERMVVYELLVRDFVADHSYATLTDTLDYLARLGVNAIELMPVTEFDGNISWGYNPNFHMALDKYYGTPESLKTFIDAAHARGLAVILDVVYNQANGESPLVRMWPGNNPYTPGADNPYLNVTARHPFNVFSDFNHESQLTREYVKTTLQYWLREFRVDGFRFDLSKGFTQNLTTSVSAWNAYDASRVAIIKDYADAVWAVDEDAYVIMEHLGESREENELAQYGQGMYFWSGFNPHDNYQEAALGYTGTDQSNLRPVLAENRGFDQRSLIAYIESHDEERTVFKNLNYGNRSGSYDIRELGTALDRTELANAFFYTLPGPKMLWQFGELGYDYPINYCTDGTINNDCRTGPKPIVWEYRNVPDRQDVYHRVADLLYVRNNYDYFHGDVTGAMFGGALKYVHLSSDDGPAAIVGNFGVTAGTVANPFPAAGTYYDYFSGETVEVTDPAAGLDLAPGEYHVYLSQDVPRGGGRLTSTNDRAVERLRFTVHPNPTAGWLRAEFTLARDARVRVSLVDLMDRPVRELRQGVLQAGPQRIDAELGDLPAGTYLLRIATPETVAVRPVIKR